MAYTAGFSVNVGDPTKASDVTTLAANDDFLKAAVDGKAALSGSTNNTVATVTGANALIGEADLTFASNKLTVFGTTGTGTATAGVLNLSTRETTVVDADQLGRIDFQAPAETGADAVLVTASIYAEADVAFDATNNATDIVLATAHDGAAAERLRITSQGEIGLAGANYGTDGQVLTSAGAGAAAAWETIPPGTTLSGSTDNTVATVTGANALQGEANLTFDGTTLAASASSGVGTISLEQTGDNGTSPEIKFVKNRGSGNAATGLSGALSFQGLDAANNTDTYAQIRGGMDDVTSGGEDGNLQFWNVYGGTLTERLRILSGGGITFNGDTAAANALDDYEEGTFTPVLKYSTTAYSLGSSTRGTYTKIGKLVWFNASINCLNPSASNDASPVTMEGLPYAVGSAADYTTHSGRMTYFIESNAWFTPYTIPSSSKIQFFYSSNSAAWGVVNSRDIYNASYANDMVITGAYMIA